MKTLSTAGLQQANGFHGLSVAWRKRRGRPMRQRRATIARRKVHSDHKSRKWGAMQFLAASLPGRAAHIGFIENAVSDEP